ncbi:MAG: cytidylate kinase-like family protein [Chloroflexota bacterium]
MPVVTIRGQLGSGAPEIGRLIADKLGIDYVDREIIEQVAKQLTWTKQGIEMKETPPGSLSGKIAESFAHYGVLSGGPLGYQGAYLSTLEIPLDDTHYLTGLESVIKELGQSNSIVVRGRGSQFILKDYPGSLHILVVAPLELRVKRIMKEMNLDEDAAKKEIARFDSSRREFIKRYFQAELENPIHYDLVINTEHLNYEAAASVVVSTTQAIEREVPGAKPVL